MNVVSHIYSGCYGGETSNIADIITCQIECPSYQPSLVRKQIIFVVDESGSMIETIPVVRASLFAARNSLLRLNGIDLSEINEENRDEIFSKTCNCCLITFSDRAICRWESKLAYHEKDQDPIDKSFSRAVNEIEADASTNMGDALQMAFDKKIPGYMTWIVVLTDGMSNKGSCQTVSGFKTLLSTMPEFTKIIPLGYTTNFDPEVLSTLGLMTYVESEENIAEIIGSITAEIATCYGVNAKISLPLLEDTTVAPDEVIEVPDIIENQPRDVIGDNNIGCLFNERKYIYGRLPWGNSQSPRHQEFIGQQGNLEYFDLLNNSMVTIPFTIQDGGHEISSEIKEAYFASSKARILLNIYTNRQHGRLNSKYIEMIRRKVEDWIHPTSIAHKEEILRVLDQNNTRAENMKALTSAHSARTQIGYNTGQYSTTYQRNESLLTSNDAYTYSAAQDPVTIPTDLFTTTT
jgi:hypothetical protein